MSGEAAGRRTLRVLQHDVLAVATGRTMGVTLDNGEVINLRLFTAEEFLHEQHRIVDEGGHGTKITLGRARELTRPLSLP